MAIRCQFENSADIGVFIQLTNTYALVPFSLGHHFRIVEQHVGQHIPVVTCSIADTRLVGRLTLGNKNGVLLPNRLRRWPKLLSPMAIR